VAGFVGGAVANQVGAGFLGGLVAGLLAGLVVHWIKKLKVPNYLRPVMPILVIPVVSSFVVGLVMYRVIGLPIREVMTFLSCWLKTMSTGNSVILAIVLGAMIAFDMGGPVNKVAFFFGAAMIKEGNFAIMGACAAAICIPPIGLGLATLLGRRLWTDEEREAGHAGLVMGMIGITEGAIPFAAADPFRVIPTIMLGSAVGSVLAMLGGVGDHAPHGGSAGCGQPAPGRRRDRCGLVDRRPADQRLEETRLRRENLGGCDEDRGRHGVPNGRRAHVHGGGAPGEGGAEARAPHQGGDPGLDGDRERAHR
jgi:fructose-specific phosphotransferase system IIC component